MPEPADGPGGAAARVRASEAIGLLLFTVAAHALLVAIDTAPQTWDPAHHLLQSMRLARDLGADGVSALLERWRAYHLYPPGGYLVGALPLLVTGPSIAWARHLQAVPLAATVLLLHLGLARSGAARPALWAAAYLGAPLALALARVTYLENLLALGVVALALRLASSRALAGWSERLAAGAIVGAGLLVKWSFALLALALAAGWLLEARRDGPLLGARTRGLCVATLVALPIAATWYLPHLGATLDDLFRHSYERTLDSPPLLSLAALARYPVELLLALGLPLLALFALALARPSARHSPGGERTAFLVPAFFVALALLTLLEHKQGRFLAPALPLVIWIVGARAPAAVGIAAAPGAIPIALLPAALVALNVGLQATPADCSAPLLRAPLPLSFPESIFPAGSAELGLGAVHRCDWGLDGMTAALAAAPRTAGAVFVRPLDDHPFLNGKTLTTHVVAARRFVVRDVADAAWIVDALAPDAIPEAPPDGFETSRAWRLPDGTLLRLAARRLSGAAPTPAASEIADALQLLDLFGAHRLRGVAALQAGREAPVVAHPLLELFDERF